ncbi:MAG: type II toxin-antitoxin system PemK/MazF family toxin, partial [Gammaproteobacteria bacterium]|nr:type II toxin-antitoxin system PemK/MazF family toxin [Gammaproteobacteria bacterium]
NHRDTLVVCPLTSNIIHQSIIRLTIQPDDQTNIDKESQVMVDKICAINKKCIKSVIGKISQTQVEALNASLKLWLDIY